MDIIKSVKIRRNPYPNNPVLQKLYRLQSDAKWRDDVSKEYTMLAIAVAACGKSRFTIASTAGKNIKNMEIELGKQLQMEGASVVNSDVICQAKCLKVNFQDILIDDEVLWATHRDGQLNYMVDYTNKNFSGNFILRSTRNPQTPNIPSETTVSSVTVPEVTLNTDNVLGDVSQSNLDGETEEIEVLIYGSVTLPSFPAAFGAGNNAGFAEINEILRDTQVSHKTPVKLKKRNYHCKKFKKGNKENISITEECTTNKQDIKRKKRSAKKIKGENSQHRRKESLKELSSYNVPSVSGPEKQSNGALCADIVHPTGDVNRDSLFVAQDVVIFNEESTAVPVSSNMFVSNELKLPLTSIQATERTPVKSLSQRFFKKPHVDDKDGDMTSHANEISENYGIKKSRRLAKRSKTAVLRSDRIRKLPRCQFCNDEHNDFLKGNLKEKHERRHHHEDLPTSKSTFPACCRKLIFGDSTNVINCMTVMPFENTGVCTAKKQKILSTKRLSGDNIASSVKRKGFSVTLAQNKFVVKGNLNVEVTKDVTESDRRNFQIDTIGTDTCCTAYSRRKSIVDSHLNLKQLVAFPGSSSSFISLQNNFSTSDQVCESEKFQRLPILSQNSKTKPALVNMENSDLLMSKEESSWNPYSPSTSVSERNDLALGSIFDVLENGENLLIDSGELEGDAYSFVETLDKIPDDCSVGDTHDEFDMKENEAVVGSNYASQSLEHTEYTPQVNPMWSAYGVKDESMSYQLSPSMKSQYYSEQPLSNEGFFNELEEDYANFS